MVKNIKLLLPAVAVVGSLALSTAIPVLNTYAGAVEDCQALTTCIVVNDSAGLKIALADATITKIVLGSDILIDEGMTIAREFTFDGNGHSISSSSNRGFVITTDQKVIIKNVSLTAAAANSIGVLISNANTYNVFIENATIRSNQFGVCDVAENSGATNGSLAVIDSTIEWIDANGNRLANYDTELSSNISYGLSNWGLDGASWMMDNSTIQGFTYAVYAMGSVKDARVTFNEVTFKSRTSLASRATATPNQNFVVQYMNSNLHGLNLLGGPEEHFGNVVLEPDSTNTFVYIVGSTFTVYENDVAMNNINANQYAVLNRAGTTNSVNVIDSTYIVSDEYLAKKKQTTPFQEDETATNSGITVIGGQYSYNPIDFVDQSTYSFEAVKNNQNLWVIVSDDPNAPDYIGDANELDVDANGDLRVFPKETLFSGGSFNGSTIKLGTPVMADRLDPLYVGQVAEVDVDNLIKLNPDYKDVIAAFAAEILDDAGNVVDVTNNKIAISFELTEEQYNKLKAFDKVAAYYVEPGSSLFTEIYDAKLDAHFDNNLGRMIYTIAFETTHLSVYAIGGVNNPAAPTGFGSTNVTSPDTGALQNADKHSAIAATVAVSVLVGMTTSVVSFVTLRRKH